jgi:hypothetical protein
MTRAVGPSDLINRKIKINIGPPDCFGGVFAGDAEGWVPNRRPLLQPVRFGRTKLPGTDVVARIRRDLRSQRPTGGQKADNVNEQTFMNDAGRLHPKNARESEGSQMPTAGSPSG